MRFIIPAKVFYLGSLPYKYSYYPSIKYFRPVIQKDYNKFSGLVYKVL